MNDYDPKETYAPGDVALHEGTLYQKLDDGDNSAPDEVPGGWELIPEEQTNLQEYLAVEQSLTSYEQRKAARLAQVAAARASAIAKLEAIGLTVDEVTALGL